MTILYLAFEFPPLSKAGVHRPLGFVKYLPEFQIEPVVVTLDRDGIAQIFKGPLDDSLLKGLPKETEVVRIPCPVARPPLLPGLVGKWFRVFFSRFDDEAIEWRANLLAALPRLLAEHRPQAIVVTMPPFSMAPFGCELARRANLPLLLDFRDAWSQWRVGPYRSWVHYWLTLRLEKKCLERADKVICTSKQTRLDFLRIHPEIVEDKIGIILNGYDQEIQSWSLASTRNKGQFQIGYVGSFYYLPDAREAMMRPWWGKSSYRMLQYVPRKEDWLYRSPYFFFRAVAALLARHPECRERLRIRFAGNKPEWIDAQVNQFGLSDVVEFVGHLDHPEVVKFQQECDALLITSSRVVGGKDYSIASKTFEYFAMRKPILSFSAEGAQKDLLAFSGMAVACDPDAQEESAEKLFDLINGRIQLAPNVPFLQKLHRRELTRQLAEEIRALVKKDTATS